jgi:hypothetical protein
MVCARQMLVIYLYKQDVESFFLSIWLKMEQTTVLQNGFTRGKAQPDLHKAVA